MLVRHLRMTQDFVTGIIGAYDSENLWQTDLLANERKVDFVLIGIFPKWKRIFIEFSEFRESDKSLKYELGSI